MKIVNTNHTERVYINGRETVAKFKNNLIQKVQSKIIHRLRDASEARDVAICISDIVDQFVDVLYVSTSVNPDQLKHMPEKYIDEQNIHRTSQMIVSELIKNDSILMTKTDYFVDIRYEVSIPFIKDSK